MQVRAFTSGALAYRQQTRPVYGGRTGRKPRHASHRTDTLAFLNERIEVIPYANSPMCDIDVSGNYRWLREAARRLMGLLHRPFDYIEKGKTDAENLALLISWIENDEACKPFDLTAVKEDDDEVHFVLSREIACLGETIFCFYLAPMDYLPKEIAMAYKRFLCFTARSLGVDIVPDRCDNHYVDMLIECEYDEEEAPYDCDIAKYVKGGEFYGKFEEVENVSTENLYADLEALRSKSDAEYVDMIDMMLEGMEILPYMNIHEYDFNPYLDGFDETDNNYIGLECTVAFLYSRNDKLEEALLDAINCDCYSGLVSQGWHKYLSLDPGMSELAVTDFFTESEMPMRFKHWAERYYDVTDKWDKYEFN